MPQSGNRTGNRSGNSTRTGLRCGQCGHVEPRWLGRCPGCGAWGSLTEEPVVVAVGPLGARPGGFRHARPVAPVRAALPITDIPAGAHRRTPTGLSELDRVLGGGLVPGSVTLLGGEPGAGKSTLLLQAAAALATGGRTVLYVSAEESPGQVRLRAERLSALPPRLLLASETDLGVVLGLVDAHAPDVLVVDSIQTVSDPDVGGSAGAVAQVRECAAALVAISKFRDMATVLVGHVTKDGQLAGPRVLEHVVDAVLDIEGERHHALRLLRATKNRFGAVGEVGCFEMTGRGLSEVVDAGRRFLETADAPPSGVAVTVALEGRRPLACEVQALVAASPLANPRRVASGLDGQRLALLVAVLERRASVALRDRDVFASSVGGVRLSEPAVDLALCLAIASGRHDTIVTPHLVALGEVGLAGELRVVGGTDRRLSEAARLGFTAAVVATAYDGSSYGLRLHRVPSLRAALTAALA